MSYLSELRAGNPEIALPPLSSPLLEPSALHHRHDGHLRSSHPVHARAAHEAQRAKLKSLNPNRANGDGATDESDTRLGQTPC
jgi:hypothetical protein